MVYDQILQRPRVPAWLKTQVEARAAKDQRTPSAVIRRVLMGLDPPFTPPMGSNDALAQAYEEAPEGTQ